MVLYLSKYANVQTVQSEAGSSTQPFNASPRAPRTVLAPGLLVLWVAEVANECLVTQVLGGTPR